MWRMIRNLFFLFLLAVFVAWMIQDPGSVVIEWRGYELRASLFVALAGIILAGVLLALLARLLSSGFALPHRIAESRRAHRLQDALRFFCEAMTAAAAEDKSQALSLARKGLERMDSERERDLGLLLATRIARLAGDEEAGADYARKMLERRELEFLGARSLFQQASERKDSIGALEYARRALNLRKDAAWAARAVFEHAAMQKKWQEALAGLDAARRANAFPTEQERRYRALVLCAMALQAESGKRFAEGLQPALEACRLLPDFAPIAAVAARLHARTGTPRKGEKIIETAWESNPHPELVDAWMTLQEGESVAEGTKRMERLVRHNRTHPESRMALARAQIAAREYALARGLLLPLCEEAAPSERVCLLMAQVETGLGNRTARDEWAARARQAPRSACWYCEGYTGDRWQPICPSSGVFDAMRWGVPPSSLGAVVEEKTAAISAAPSKSDAPEPSVAFSPPDDPGPRLRENA